LLKRCAKKRWDTATVCLRCSGSGSGERIPLIRRGKREGIPAEETGMAGPPARREGGQEASGIDGDGGEPVLRASGQQDNGRVDAGIAEQAWG